MINHEIIQLGDKSFTLRQVIADDEQEVLRLFTQVFAEAPPENWYKWKYTTDGLNGIAIGLWEDTGKLVAHCAGFPRLLYSHAEPVHALQIGDLMVAPEWRGLLTRHGPFWQVCHTLFERYVGNDKAFPIAFGFTHKRSMRLGVKLGLFEDKGAIMSFSETVSRPGMNWGWSSKDLQANPDLIRRHADLAWQAMLTQSNTIVFGERNTDYLIRRYLSRPAHHYRFIRISRWFKPTCGIIVLKIAGQTAQWIDFVGAISSLPIAWAALNKFAAQNGYERIEGWAAGTTLIALQQMGLSFEEVTRFARIRHSCRPDINLFDDGIWLSGDTDFI